MPIEVDHYTCPNCKRRFADDCAPDACPSCGSGERRDTAPHWGNRDVAFTPLISRVESALARKRSTIILRRQRLAGYATFAFVRKTHVESLAQAQELCIARGVGKFGSAFPSLDRFCQQV